jgi:hypothetical protein
MKRGRKLKLHCTCGILKTSQNTFVRKNGYLMDVCKQCDNKRSLQRSRQKLTDIQILKRISKHEHEIKVLKTELMRRDK